MSVALYRKYRPGSFGEVRGQDHVTEPLRQALRNGRINHAYLFSGPRGCGKTTSARILARSLNCVEGPTPDPCGSCDSCVGLAPDGAGSIDVIEIDAASHGGVDDARELRERAFFAPVSARYKIYIIDEAHMVTREGFNALLKLVEEPPPHLKFIFATTEPDKVISTIRSRTHHYPFRLIPPATLQQMMEEILASEGIAHDPGALSLVVRAGAGSARDSLSVLDQLLAGSDEHGITREAAVALLGYTDSALLAEMVDALGAGDGAATFELLDRVVEGGHDPRRFTADLLERFRDLVVLTAVPRALDKGLINVPPDAAEPMRQQAERIGAGTLTRAADLLNTGLTEMRGATAPRLLLEIVCARVLLAGEPTAPTGTPAPRPSRPAHPPAAERSAPAPGPGAALDPSPAESAAPPRPAPTPAAATAPEPAAPSPPTPDTPPSTAGSEAEEPSLAPITRAWPRILEAVKARRRFTWMILTGNEAAPLAVQGRSLQLGFQRGNDAKGFASSGSDQVVQAAIHDVLGLDLHVVAVNSAGAPPPPHPPEPSFPSPAVAEPAPSAPAPPPADTSPGSALPASPPEPPQRRTEPSRSASPTSRPEAEPPAMPSAADPGPVSLIQQELGGRVLEEIEHERH